MRLKRMVSRIPGSIETYKLLKNLRYLTRARLGTAGNLESLSMNREEACRYVHDIFRKIDEVVQGAGGWAGKNALEIGPGDSLGAGLLAIAKGARSYCAIDRFPVRFDLDSERGVLEDLRPSLSREERERLEEAVQITDEGFRSDRFAYHNSIPIEAAPQRLSGRTFEVIFSNAVLEHVENVESSLESIERLLSPDGVMLHDVDLRSHQRFEKHSMHFLEYSTLLWKLMTSHTGEPNRVRLPEYRRILERLGFREIRFQITACFDGDLVKRVKPSLDKEFRSLPEEDLAVAAFRVSARAPLSETPA